MCNLFVKPFFEIFWEKTIIWYTELVLQYSILLGFLSCDEDLNSCSYKIISEVITPFNFIKYLTRSINFFYLGKVPTRFKVAFLLFMASFTFYMLRVNISINIIAMVKPKLDTAIIFKNLTLNNKTDFSSLQEIPVADVLPDVRYISLLI